MNNSRTHLLHVGIAIMLLVIMTMQLFTITDEYKIGMLLSVTALLIVRPLPFMTWTFTDRILGIIVVFDLLSCSWASCQAPAIRSALFSVYSFTIYLLLRKLSINLRIKTILQTGSYLPISIALLLAIGSFFIFRNSVLEAGFTDTYHFRFLFRPLGYITNVWAEILLILLGWVCLIRRYNTFFIFTIVFAILLSFSRGAYIALAVYIVIWIIAAIPLRKKIMFLTASLFATGIILFCFPQEMKTTLKMNITASQQRSTEWRIETTCSALEIWKEHPLLGWGNGNYTYAIDPVQNQDSTQSFTSFAPNIFTELLIEKGIIGFLLYLLLAAGICQTVWKRRKEQEAWIVLCTLLAVLTKETSQATLFSTGFAEMMCFILLAFLQPIPKDYIQKEKSSCAFLVSLLALLTYTIGTTLKIVSAQNEEWSKKCFEALANDKLEKAEYYIEQTSHQVPYLIERGIFYTDCYCKTKEYHFAEKAEHFLRQAKEQMPQDIQIAFLQAYLWLQSGNLSKAYNTLKTLTETYPKNSLYLWTFGKILRQTGCEEKSLQATAEAIRYTPRLLTMQCLQNERDTVYANKLTQRLISMNVNKDFTPADYARYGYIMHKLGKTEQAIPALRKAITELPNLVTPWGLLQEKKKYRLLLLGAFQTNDAASNPIPEISKMTEHQLLYSAYKAKFEGWYGCELKGHF